jgi:hypothetical protein
MPSCPQGDGLGREYNINEGHEEKISKNELTVPEVVIRFVHRRDKVDHEASGALMGYHVGKISPVRKPRAWEGSSDALVVTLRRYSYR